MPKQTKASNLIWIDLEMTGLKPESDRIIEIATLVTDSHLNLLAEGPTLAISQSKQRLEKLDSWNIKHHTASGLLDRVRASKIKEREAEEQTIAFLKQYVSAGKSPMCGNSICQDRRFLYHYMPELEKYFHYRNLDVSTLKELARRWKPEIMRNYKKKSKHIAMQDIRDGIDELKFYREHFITV